MVTEVIICHVGVVHLGGEMFDHVVSGTRVSGAGGCSFLLHPGQSEQLDSLQHSTHAAVQVDRRSTHVGGGAY